MGGVVGLQGGGGPHEFLFSLHHLSANFVILRSIQRDATIKLQRSSCNAKDVLPDRVRRRI